MIISALLRENSDSNIKDKLTSSFQERHNSLRSELTRGYYMGETESETVNAHRGQDNMGAERAIGKTLKTYYKSTWLLTAIRALKFER